MMAELVSTVELTSPKDVITMASTLTLITKDPATVSPKALVRPEGICIQSSMSGQFQQFIAVPRVTHRGKGISLGTHYLAVYPEYPSRYPFTPGYKREAIMASCPRMQAPLSLPGFEPTI